MVRRTIKPGVQPRDPPVAANPEDLLRQLRSAQAWLTREHGASLGDLGAGIGFRAVLVRLHEYECDLRASGYMSCIWAPGSCPAGGFIVCDVCFLRS